MNSSARSSGRSRTTRAKNGGAAIHGQSGIEQSERDPPAVRRIHPSGERNQNHVKQQIFVAAVAEQAEARPRDRRADAVLRVVARHREVIVRIGVPQNRHPQKEEGKEKKGGGEKKDKRQASGVRRQVYSPPLTLSTVPVM